MKSILKSLKPKTIVNILNGNATLFINKDVRLYKATKKLIEEQGYATFFMYCTKDNENELVQLVNGYGSVVGYDLVPSKLKIVKRIYNGKVVAMFTVRKVEEIEKYTYPKYYGEDVCDDDDFYYLESQPLSERRYDGLQKTTCLSEEELYDYLDDKQGYAYHIEDLVIFDKPKELNDFMPIKWGKCGVKDKNGLYQCHKCPYGEVMPYGGECHYKPLKRPPQNFMYIESEE